MSVIVARSPGTGGGSTSSSSGPVTSQQIVIGVTDTTYVDAVSLSMVIGAKWLVTIQTQDDRMCAYEVYALAMPTNTVQFSIGFVLGDVILHEVDVLTDIWG